MEAARGRRRFENGTKRVTFISPDRGGTFLPASLNGLVERMNRALKEATVKRYYPHQSRATKAGIIHLDWEDSMAVPFDKYAARGAYHWHEASRLGVRFNAPLVSRYSSVLKRIPSGAKEILDLGCGDGYLTCLIAKSFPQSIVIGVDGDQSGVDIARYCARNVSNARFEFNNNNNLPFADRSFDVVVMADVIEHLIDVGGMLLECRRILKPCGSLIVTTPNRQNGSKWDERHIFEFSGQELKTEIAGQFENVELFGSWPMHYFTTWRRKRGGRAFLDVTARLGWNAFDREVRDPDATYGQLLVSARAPEE